MKEDCEWLEDLNGKIVCTYNLHRLEGNPPEEPDCENCEDYKKTGGQINENHRKHQVPNSRLD